MIRRQAPTDSRTVAAAAAWRASFPSCRVEVPTSGLKGCLTDEKNGPADIEKLEKLFLTLA